MEPDPSNFDADPLYWLQQSKHVFLFAKQAVSRAKLVVMLRSKSAEVRI